MFELGNTNHFIDFCFWEEVTKYEEEPWTFYSIEDKRKKTMKHGERQPNS